MNRLKTLILLASLTALLLFLGQIVGGRQGVVIALVLAGVMNLGSYWFSDKIVLATYRAREVSPAEAPEFYGAIQELSTRGSIPMPRVYVIPEEAPNAFATGRDPEHAAVAATEGLLRLLDRNEIIGVMSHELSHVQNRDTLIMSVAATLGGAIGFLSRMAFWFGGGHSSDDRRGGNAIGALIGLIVAPLAAMLIQLAVSRSREYLADESGARLAGNPLALASALKKLEGYKKDLVMQHGTPATAHLFIVNPFTMKGIASLFSTHPPTEERVARLQAMAMNGGIRPT
ncbi:MAG TPA: zinc metalloprotease HtpX [Thermoanaerobaculia bacterium]|nr:zinc metalloprotease HtpX [Thermoanaerobaculia bacterium]